MAKPWMDSSDIIEAVKRKIALPISQNTFSEDDILKFANEEMFISQVPSMLQFHEEYFVTSVLSPLITDQSRYPIPDRAIGMKLRDLSWSDPVGNIFEMTRINADDKSFFQRNIGANQAIHKFYLEGNDVVLTPSMVGNQTGSLLFNIYLRPNQLVTIDRAATISSFVSNVIINNASLVDGDTLTIFGVTFTAVSGSPTGNQFQIGATSVITATNLVTAITMSGVAIATNGTPSTNNVLLSFSTLSASQSITTSNSSGFGLNSAIQGIQFQSVPSNITNNAVIDFLQTKPGHRTYLFDITIPSNAITGNIIYFQTENVPANIIVGDYICLANECIIPQIPPDLHNMLAEKTCSRILAALGDQAGLQATQAKIAEMESKQGALIDNRVEGSAQKVLARHSILRFTRMGVRRRL